MSLTPDQQSLNQKRIQEHQHSRYEVDIVLDSGLILKDFIIYPNVLRADKTSGLYFAKYLSSNPDLYKNKKVLDMGCGSGIQGIVVGSCGATQVTFSDISTDAVSNAKENIERFKITQKSVVYEGDLFEKINDTYDVIIFNHPFFSEKPLKEFPVTIAFFDDGKLIHKFLDEAPRYLNPGGSIIMPFFEFAGEVNNPEIQAPLHDYDVALKYKIDVNDENIQKGIFSVFELKKI